MPLDRFLASVSCAQIGLLFDHQSVGMDIHAHGRTVFSETGDFSRTIGFLRATHPFVFPSAPASFWETAKARSARIPVATFSFDALRFGGTDDHLKARLARLPPCEILLNFNGALNTVSSFDGQMIRQSAMSLGVRRSPVQTEPYKIKLHGAVVAGQIILSIEYSSGDYRENTARSIIENIGAGLLRLAQF